MSTAAAIVVAAPALACPLHIVWRVLRVGARAASPLDAVRRPRIESLAPSEARRDAAPERH